MRGSSQPRHLVSRSGVCRALALAVCLVACARPAHAGSGAVFRLPSGGVAPKNGLQLIVDTRWVDGNGYVPVKVSVLPWPAGPATASRTIQVVLSPNPWPRGSESYQVTGYVELAEGATRGEATLAVHQAGRCEGWSVKVYEDGTLLEDLCDSNLWTQSPNMERSEALPVVLIIDADAPSREAREQLIRNRNMSGTPAAGTAAPGLPDLRQLPPSFASPDYDRMASGATAAATAPPVQGQPNDSDTLFELETKPRLELLPPAELPQRWIDFTCFDMIFISAADLQTLATQHPASWQAIRQWLATGPTLCVYDMQLSPEELGRLETLLALSAPAGGEPSGPTRALWRAPDPRTASSDEVSALVGLRRQYATYPPSYSPPYAQPAADSPAEEAPPPVATPPEEAPFLVRDVDRGRVVAMSAKEPLVNGRYELSWLLNDLGSPAWMWYQRHGMSFYRPNVEYWNWVVPGIGLTPVGSFLVLIALFVVCIGPVNYFLLRRWRRLYMLLVTVPAGAALVTVALFAYAVVCDGLGVRVRVRGLTEIDQRRELTVSWSRQSYYAGLAPSEGLRFPEHAAVYPIEQEPTEPEVSNRRVVWDGDQHLAAGYLTSRSTTQLLVIDAGPSAGGLKFVEGSADPPALEVTNQLPATLDQLAVWDSAGRCFWSEGLAPGVTATMTPIQTAKVSQTLRQVLAAHQPGYPAGYDYYDNGWTGRGRYFGTLYYGMTWDGGLPAPSFSTGILERGLAQAAGFAATPQPEPRSYVAITQVSPGVPLGYSRAREEASIYVIQGKW